MMRKVFCFLGLLSLPLAAATGLIYEQNFDVDSDANGVADGCGLVGNPKITAKCALDGDAAAANRAQLIEVLGGTLAEQVGVATRAFGVKAGKTYRVSFKYKTADLNGASALAFLSWYDNSAKKFDNVMLLSFVSDAKMTAWTPVVVTFSPKVNADVSAQLRLCVSRAGGTGKIWYDDFRVEETGE